ncbi:MAG: ATP-binding protein [Chloroflexota bacterium]
MPRQDPRAPALAEPRLPRFTGWLRPVVDAVARIDASVHRKLLFGFLAGAVLLVAMAVLSVLIIERMNDRVGELDRLQDKASGAQQMLYLVTAQSHYRAMALLTLKDSYNQQIADAKATFVELLDAMEREDPADAPFFGEITTANDDFATSSAAVLSLYESGEIEAATELHIAEEHTASHVLETQMRTLIGAAGQEMSVARSSFGADRTLLELIVIVFSAVAVGVAMFLGYALSWAFILPVRKMERALVGITAGELAQQVEVSNRDELGRLATHLNVTSERLSELFDEQHALSERLTVTNESLARASEAKSRFLASVSHELRTPMNAILGFTDALLAGVDGPLNDEQRASLGWVQRGGRDLLGLINEILDLSKIEAGKLTLEARPFDPRELLESVVAQHRSLAAQKGIQLTWHDDGAPAEVVLDRQRVQQILVNLLGNALKFTEQGEVSVAANGAAERSLHVAVRDTGPGIAAEKFETIFEEFARVDGDAPGTGLGLAICRRLARVMGGDVTLESEVGRGSVFHLGLPLDSRLASPSAFAAAAGPGGAVGLVLLSVDDDPSVFPLLQKMLTGHGYRVVATSPGEAVADARRLQPAAILLDILMPERNGGEILAELKDDPLTRQIPVIVLSVVEPADLQQVATAHLNKPVRQEALLEALAQHVPARQVES